MERTNDYYIIDKKTDMLIDMVSLSNKEYKRYLKNNPKHKLELVEVIEEDDEYDDNYNPYEELY